MKLQNGLNQEHGNVSVTGKKVGSAIITITAEDVGDTSENEVTGNIEVKITVNSSPEEPKPPTEPATLTKLVVAGKTYNNPAKSITVKVDNSVTSAKIVPTTSNGESFTIDKGNNVKLEEGTNTVKITLASGNVYTVYIRRAAKEVDTPNVIDDTKEEEEPTEDIKLGLKSLSLQGVIQTEEGEQVVELPYLKELFSSEVYVYNINLSEQERAITGIKIEALANKEDAIVEITGNENLVEGDNIITIIVKSANGEETVTYQIIVNKPEEQILPINANIEMQEQNGVGWGPIQKTLITIFTSIIVMFGIAYGVIEYRYKKEDKDEFGIPYSNIETTTENKKVSKPKAKKNKKEEKENVGNNVLNNSIQEATGKFRSKKDLGKHF